MYGVATQISYELNTIVAARVLDFGGGQTNVNKDTSFGGVAHPHDPLTSPSLLRVLLMEISVRGLDFFVSRLQIYADAQVELKCAEQVHAGAVEAK
jgi:hypothetical protein